MGNTGCVGGVSEVVLVGELHDFSVCFLVPKSSHPPILDWDLTFYISFYYSIICFIFGGHLHSFVPFFDQLTCKPIVAPKKLGVEAESHTMMGLS